MYKYPDEEIGKKWRPSNGTDAAIFISNVCRECTVDTMECNIIGLTLIHDVEDDEYPIEWRIDENGNPNCFARDVYEPPKKPRCKQTIDMFPESGGE